MVDNLSNRGVRKDMIFDNLATRLSNILPSVILPTAVRPAGAVAYDTGSSVPVYSNGLAWLPFGGATGGSFVFRPGYTGPDFPNIFSTWAELITALALVAGPKTIFFDGTDGALVIPAGGPYDMSEVTWLGSLCPAFSSVTIPDGATFLNLCNITSLGVTYTGTSGPACSIDLAGTATAAHLDIGASVSCTGTSPFWSFTDSVGGGAAVALLGFGASLLDGGNPVVDSSAGFSAVFLLGPNSTLDDDTLSGLGKWIINLDDSSANLTLPFLGANFPAAPLIVISDNLLCPKINTSGVAPAATNDITEGFKIGDTWVDTATDTVYIAADVSTGAAVWNAV
jgi:hypothetical protein